MDFNMKQWRDEESEEEEQETSSCSKLPRLDINPHPSPPALSLFAPQPTTTHFQYSSDHSSATKLPPRMGSYFSLAQWQELELQTLVFRHLISGAAVPPELLHLVKKSLVPSTPYYFCNPLHYHPSLLQSGYWGKAAMDPEPGRCRRTDGKKWRCSRDVVVGQKYCERHMHRGRNRSRKPVEIPTSAASGGGEAVKASITALSHGMPAAADGGGGAPRFSLTGPFTSMDLLHHNRRPMSEKKWTFVVGNENGGDGDGRLRHFFDDWPRSVVDEAATNLSISRSDFSLKLGSGDEREREGGRERGDQVSWGMAAAWESSSRMGGPLAEALRSTSSPTSVLHRLQMTSASASASQTSS